MVPQPSPNKRFPGSFFVKRGNRPGKPASPLHLDSLENRTTPAGGWGAALFSVPQPDPELSHIAAVNPDESLDLVGEATDCAKTWEEESSLDGEWKEEDILAQESAQEIDQAEVSQVSSEMQTPLPEPATPAIVVDMRRKPGVDLAEVARVVIRSLEIELGRHGTATAGASSFGSSDPVFPSGLAPTSQFLIRPGLVKPISFPEKSVRPSSGELIAWGAVMASGTAHLATSYPAKRRLSVESKPAY